MHQQHGEKGESDTADEELDGERISKSRLIIEVGIPADHSRHTADGLCGVQGDHVKTEKAPAGSRSNLREINDEEMTSWFQGKDGMMLIVMVVVLVHWGK